MDLRQNFRTQFLFYLLLGIWVALHVPFLRSDPDFQLSLSRDAHTDEELNTNQLRNFINFGTWDVWEGDNLVKCPLLNVWLLPCFLLFGTQLLVARTAMIILITVLLIFIGRGLTQRLFLLLLIPLGLTQFHIFQYSHFSMAEMAASVLILASVLLTGRFLVQRKMSWLLLASTATTAAWWFKFQFVYIFPLVPLVTGLFFFYQILKKKEKLSVALAWTGKSIFLSFSGFAAYFIFWFLPLKDPWLYFIRSQSSGRILEQAYWQETWDENFSNYFDTPELFFLRWGFYMLMPLGVLIWFYKPGRFFSFVFPILLLWLGLEAHKMLIKWTPSRYLVSLLLCMASIMAATLLEIIRQLLFKMKEYPPSIKMAKSVALFVVCIFWGYGVWTHSRDIGKIYERRTWQIAETSHLLENMNLKKGYALGPWAPSLTWGKNLRAIPVWRDYLNDKNMLDRFQPILIVSEFDEMDSDHAFTMDGIELDDLALKKINRTIGKWEIVIYLYEEDSR